MRREVWIHEMVGYATLILFENDEPVALYWCESDDYEAELNERFAELKADPKAYLRWESGYNNDTIWKASEVDCIDKYDEEGEEVDLQEHPWTLKELCEADMRDSCQMNPLHVVKIHPSGDEETARIFYEEENAKKFARTLAETFDGKVEIRAYDHDVDDDDWDGCMDHKTIPYELPPRLDGRKVRIVFEGGEIADIFGEITFAEENRIHIVRES